MYEYEAHELALLYMVRCGYDPGGLTRLLDTMQSVHARNADIFDLNYRNHPDVGERVKRIQREMRDYRNFNGKRYEDDFRRNMIF
jgi:predicted Zn-dependent protease